jgi:two-component sensor histidine kinase
MPAAAELTDYRLIAVRLRKALAKSEALLLQKDELIHRQELLKAESDHRLLNDLQMTISLLSLQSRNSINPEAASQLSAAANRVSMIARIHHRLHSYEGVRTIGFKKFLQDLGANFLRCRRRTPAPEKLASKVVRSICQPSPPFRSASSPTS